MSKHSQRVLLVEGDADAARAVVKALTRLGVTSTAIAASIADARALLANGDWDGVIVNYELPDGVGTELVHHLQSGGRITPMLVQAGICDGSAPHRAHLVRVQALDRSTPLASLGHFLRRLGHPPGDLFCRARSFTKTERAVFGMLLDGLSVPRIAQKRGVSECTVRAQVRSMLAKSGAHSIRRMVAEALDPRTAVVRTDDDR